MYFLALIGGLACLAIWIYLLTAHGGFWKVETLYADVQPAATAQGTIVVVIPARDEADLVGASVRSLLGQTCASLIHIFVVDDHSLDGTADAAIRAAQDCERTDALDVITGSALPS
jgi:hypothetical protein